jgi:hypothetical protein
VITEPMSTGTYDEHIAEYQTLATIAAETSINLAVVWSKDLHSFVLKLTDSRGL